jgi:transposase
MLRFTVPFIFQFRRVTHRESATHRGRASRRARTPHTGRWKRLLGPLADAELRAARLGRDLRRWQDLQTDIALAEQPLAGLLKQTAGQVLTTLPGIAVVRAAALSAYTLPIERWPTAEHLYSATGLAPATYQSSTITRRAKISPPRSRRAPRRADEHHVGPVALQPRS